MGRKIGAYALLLLSLFMLYGFARSGAGVVSAKGLIALIITVFLPAAGGIALLRGSLGGTSKTRMNQLRQQTIDAEILKLAMKHQGRLTAVEVEGALALPAGEAKASLDKLVEREVADLEITDDGVLVYTFHDARYFEGKGLIGG